MEKTDNEFIREFINDVFPVAPKGELSRAVMEDIERGAIYEAFVCKVLVSESAKGLSC